MKQNNKRTDFDCSRLSDSDATATSCINPAHWLWRNSFNGLKISQNNIVCLCLYSLY